MTWFDALLVTLWALITALGIRRGLAGLLWGLGGVTICFLINRFVGQPLVAGALTLLLAVGLSAVSHRLIPTPAEHAGHLAGGALGGFLLGGVLVGTLALGFPLDVRVTPQGRAATYPSASLPPAVYDAVNGSVIKDALNGVWGGNQAIRTLLVPDQIRNR